MSDPTMNDLLRRMDEGFRENEKALKEAKQAREEIDRKLGDFEKKTGEKLDELGNGFALVKGSLSLMETLLESSNILNDLGMRGNTHLSKKEIDSLVDQIAGSVNLTPGQWQSLRDIDVLMEVFDENEKKYLVAVSVSWTIAGKDVYSAIGHARSLRNVPGVQGCNSSDFRASDFERVEKALRGRAGLYSPVAQTLLG